MGVSPTGMGRSPVRIKDSQTVGEVEVRSNGVSVSVGVPQNEWRGERMGLE